ncbi:MAG: Isovaleryl-CoA dehydrogenase 1, partial [Frankiales bacterium]|nr:Isovaleryl-CoA dehydrogenase 1 [Frankiales bacterium]
MALALSDEHVALADVVRTFVRDQQVRAAARTATESTEVALPAFWAPLVEQGWLGLHLPEEHGGHGYGLPELAIVLEGLGLEAAPGPFLPTVLASAWLAQSGASTALLPALADGSAIAAVGLAGTLTGAASGTWDAVLGAPYADQLVLAAGDDVLVVSAKAPGVTVHPQPGLDLGRPSGRVVLDGATDVVVVAGGARTLRELARVLTAAEAAGGAQACLEMARSYALQRTQFGRTIGTFQAVKHHLANMLADSEAAVATAWDAARAPQGTDQASLAAAVAASRALPAYQRVAQKAIQVLGGIGFT